MLFLILVLCSIFSKNFHTHLFLVFLLSLLCKPVLQLLSFPVFIFFIICVFYFFLSHFYHLCFIYHQQRKIRVFTSTCVKNSLSHEKSVCSNFQKKMNSSSKQSKISIEAVTVFP